MGLKGYLKRTAFAAMAAAALAVRSSPWRRRTSGAATKASSSGGTATMALDENLAGFNINTSAAIEFVLQEILNMVWPQAFIVNNKLQPVLNSQLLESATVTSTSPQTVVYKLNPKAVWSGRHADHRRRLHLQLAGPEREHRLHRRRQPALRRRLDRRLQPDPVRRRLRPVRTVPPAPPAPRPTATSACARTAHRHRHLQAWPSPTGGASSPTSSRPTSPARSAGTPASPARRRPSPAAGTQIQSYNANQSLVLTRNPKYWGTPGKLNKLVFQFFSDDTQLVPALQNKEINIFNPSTVNLSIVQTANQVPRHHQGRRCPGWSSSTSTSTRPTPTWPSSRSARPSPTASTGRRSSPAPSARSTRASPRSAAACWCPPRQGYKGTRYAYSPTQSNNL